MKTPGVLAVLTGADAVADGLGAIPHRPVPTNPHEVPLKSRDGSPFFVSPHAPLPADRARFVGEPVALVVAETAGAARDGAERVVIDWQPRPAAVTAAAATTAGAPAVWDACPSNLCVDSEAGDAAATDAAFARAAHVVQLQTRVNRVTGVPTGAPHGRRRLRCRQRALHRLRRLGRLLAHPGRRGRHPRRAGGRGARDRPRRRWQLRHPQQLLPGVRAGGVGRPAARSAREVDGRPA